MDAEEATLKRAMVACSSRVIVAATTEKLGARGNWQIASLDEIDDLVLTTTAPPALAARFRAAGIAVHPTPPDRTAHVPCQPRACRTARDPRCVLHSRLRHRAVGHPGAVRQGTHRDQRRHAGPGAALPRCRFAAGDAVVRRAGRAPRLPAGDGGQQPADLPDRARPGAGRFGLDAGLVLFVFGAAVGRWTAR
jgi:hypothetical protein